MADVRTFRAATMREALDLVRDELGADAVILHTRQVERRRYLPWRKAVEDVEITATLTLDPSSVSVAGGRGDLAVAGLARSGDRARTPGDRARTAADRKRAKRSVAPAAPASLQRLPASPAIPSTSRRLDLISEPSASVAEVLGRAPETEEIRRSAPRRASHAEPIEPVAEIRLPQSRSHRFTRPLSGSQSVAVDASDPTAALGRRLDAIHQMLHELGRATAVARRDEIPSELFQLYTDLIDAEVEDDLARELVIKLKRSASPRQISDAQAAKALLTAMVESEIRCCEPITPKPGRRKVVALVGATGVGKTTTIAKLAANFRLRSAIKMGLVTVDTYRVAAVEQLRTYAEIIDLPMKVVTSPLEMRRALEELIGLDLVLIDTAGRSPKDELQIQELKSLLSEAHVDEVDLVLSMTSSLRSLESSAAMFAGAGTTGLILTKLDEASGMGTLLSVARSINLPIRYLTAGQTVPDDIEPAHPRRIARLVLGQEGPAK